MRHIMNNVDLNKYNDLNILAERILSNTTDSLENIFYFDIKIKLAKLIEEASDSGENFYYKLYHKLGWEDLPVIRSKLKLDSYVNWKDISTAGDYILQQNILDKSFSRIISKDRNIVAIGNSEVMAEKLRRITSHSFFAPGDIIAIDRMQTDNISMYAHYGIFWDEQHVIHYTGDDDLAGDIYIKFDTLKNFLVTKDRKYKLQDCHTIFIKSDGHPCRIYQDLNDAYTHINGLILYDLDKDVTMNNYTYAKTLARAEAVALKFGSNSFKPLSTIEERLKVKKEDIQWYLTKNYSLDKNNCEHFAIWCKTGKHISVQAKSAGSVATAMWVLYQLLEDNN